MLYEDLKERNRRLNDLMNEVLITTDPNLR